MIQLGRFKNKNDIKNELNLTHDDILPSYFDPDQLKKITSEQVVWFDECHFDQDGGPPSLNDMQIRFPRDGNGVYSIGSNSYNKKQSRPSYKYPEQARFCFGVAKVKLLDGSIIGRRCRLFDYTGKKMVSISDYEKLITKEIDRVKSMHSPKGN